MFLRRLAEIAIGVALIAFTLYTARTGTARGAYRTYDRATEPWSFWLAVVIPLAIGAAFLFGATSWR